VLIDCTPFLQQAIADVQHRTSDVLSKAYPEMDRKSLRAILGCESDAELEKLACERNWRSSDTNNEVLVMKLPKAVKR
jgi:hypothetical protein